MGEIERFFGEKTQKIISDGLSKAEFDDIWEEYEQLLCWLKVEI